MKKFRAAVLFLTVYLLSFPQFIFSQNQKEFVKFKAKIGFVNGEDKIIDYRFSDDGNRLFIRGSKNVQLWDVENGKLLHSLPYSVQEYKMFGKLAAVLSFGISNLIKTGNIKNNSEDNYFVAIEGQTKDERKAVVREITTGKELAVLELPYPTKSVSINENVILTTAEKTDETQIGIWDNSTFQQKTIFSVNQFKWFHFFNNGEKILIGSGDTRISWDGDLKQGNKFEIRDVKSGKIEKEFTAPNLNPKDYYHETALSKDERLLLSRRANKIYVWDINGDGSPKYVIAPDTPNGDLDLVVTPQIPTNQYILKNAAGIPQSIISGAGKVVDNNLMIIKADKKLKIYDFEGDGKPKLVVPSGTPKGNTEFRGLINLKYLAAETDKKLQIYEIDGDGKPKYEFVSNNPDQKYRLIGYTSDGKYFVIRNKEKLSFYEMDGNGQPFSEVSLLDKEINSIRYLSEGYCLIKNKRKDKKEAHISYLYNIKTGKIDYEIPHEYWVANFSSDKKLVYEEMTGSFFAWNLPEKKSLSLSLDTYTTTCNTDSNGNKEASCSEETRNSENVALSPNEKFFVKYGKDTTIYDAETGNVAQNIFDPQKVTYNKNRQIKYSGFNSIKFSNDGTKLFAFDSPVYGQTITIWDLID